MRRNGSSNALFITAVVCYYSADACSEIGEKWFLFLSCSSWAVLGLVSVFDFFAVYALSRTRRIAQRRIETIFQRALLMPKATESSENTP
jgi:hypothetical protein